MIGYVFRRLLYGVLILIGVNLFTFVLFFAVNTPDDMARLSIGGQRVSADAIEKWKAERGYDKPLMVNTAKEGLERYTDTIFYQRSLPLLRFDFGASDSGLDISREISQRMWPSLALAIPTFILGLLASVAFSVDAGSFSGTTRLDFWGRGAVCGDALDLWPVLHHCWTVAICQNFALSAVLGFCRWLGHGEVFGLAGIGGDHCPFGSGGAVLSQPVSGGNRQGLCANGSGQRLE